MLDSHTVRKWGWVAATPASQTPNANLRPLPQHTLFLVRGLLQYKRKIVHTRARLAHWRRDTDINPRGLDKFVTAVRYKNSGRDRCFVPFLFPFLFSAFFP